MASKLGEFGLIETYFAPLTKSVEGAFNLGDDAAVVVPPAGKSMVITTDTIVEGVHFFSDDSPGDVAAKLLRVSLSDLAAMGSVPAYYNLSIAMTKLISDQWLEKFTNGLKADQDKYGIFLIGGDTVSTLGPLTLTVTAIGFNEVGKTLRRNGAKIDDDIWVSGSIGDAALGLKVAQGKLNHISEAQKKYLVNRYKRPDPRIELVPNLVSGVNAAIDVSDGLIADLSHICSESKVGADIHISSIPLSRAVRSVIKHEPSYLELVLRGGDDFELLFTADRSIRDSFQPISKNLDINLTRIGSIVDTRSVRIFDHSGVEFLQKINGYTHF